MSDVKPPPNPRERRCIFPIVWGILFLGAIYVCRLAASLIPIIKEEPSYVQWGIPILIFAPIYFIILFDIENLRTQSLTVFLTLAATFLGTSLAFIQADIQNAQGEREIFARAIEMATFDLAMGYGGASMLSLSDIDYVGYQDFFMSGLRDFINSEKTAKFLKASQIYDLQLAYEAIFMYRDGARDKSKTGPDRLEDAKWYYRSVKGFYSNLCSMRASIYDNFDYSAVEKWIAPRFIANSPGDSMTYDNLIALIPEKCRQVPSPNTLDGAVMPHND
jgi:hypothetical protein